MSGRRVLRGAAGVLSVVLLTACGSNSAAPTPSGSASATPDAAVVKQRRAAGIADCPASNLGATAVTKGLPAVVLDCIGGDTRVNLAGLAKGKPMVLNFWAQWCGPCRTEGPWFGAAYAKSKAKGLPVTFLGVDEVDPIGADAALAMAIENKQLYPLLVDELGTARGPMGFSGLPQTFLIDGQGRIVHRQVGLLTSQADLERQIATYLGVTL